MCVQTEKQSRKYLVCYADPPGGLPYVTRTWVLVIPYTVKKKSGLSTS